MFLFSSGQTETTRIRKGEEQGRAPAFQLRRPPAVVTAPAACPESCSHCCDTHRLGDLESLLPHSIPRMLSSPKPRYNQVTPRHTYLCWLSRVNQIKSRILHMAFKSLTYSSCFLQLSKPLSIIHFILAYLKLPGLILYFPIIFI